MAMRRSTARLARRMAAAAGAAAPARAAGAGAAGAAAAAARAATVPAARAALASVSTTRGFTASAAAAQPEPHGGKLVDLMVSAAKRDELMAAAAGKSMECSDRNACDVELLAVGGFSPLEGFMDEAEYDSVVDNHRLQNGLLFGLPVVLDTDSEDLKIGDTVALTYKGQTIGAIEIGSKWEPNKVKETKQCYGTSELEHPGTLMVATERGKYYIGGKVYGFELPTREFDCQTPAEVREMLPKDKDVVAFQCRNPVHRAHYELFTRAAHDERVGPDATVLVHPTCGPTQGDDIPGDVRYRTYVVLKDQLNDEKIQWAYLPYSMHMAGPREALQHMMIRKNYGCTHFIIGRDMAGSKSSITGEDYYGAYDAQDFANEIAEELGVKTVPSLNVVYTEEEGYVTADVAQEKGLSIKKLSGTKFRKMLRAGDDIPEWFAFKSVVDVLREAQK